MTETETLETLVVRRRRRPLALQPSPGQLRWACPCESCRDLLVAELKELIDAPAEISAIPDDEADVMDSWRAIAKQQAAQDGQVVIRRDNLRPGGWATRDAEVRAD